MYIFCNNYSEKLSEFHIHDDLYKLIGPTTGTSRRPVIELVFFFSKLQTCPTQENHKIKCLFNVAP